MTRADNGINLQYILEDILGSRNVYFQPPENLKMKFPCIRYSLDNIKSTRADDRNYYNSNSYQIIYIDDDPDSEIPDRILDLPMCRFERFYTADNLNHWVFTLTYK